MDLCTECTESNLICTMSECKKLCYHMYECDQLCYDYTNGHLCKHIHRVDSIRLLETNDLDKDFQYESLCTSNTHEHLSSGSDFDDNLEFAESLRNPTTGKKWPFYWFINFVNSINVCMYMFTYCIVHVYLLIIIITSALVQTHQSNFRHFSCTWNSWKKLWLWRTHLFIASYLTSIHFYTVQYSHAKQPHHQTQWCLQQSFKERILHQTKIRNISGDLNKLGKHLEEKKGMYYG